MYLQIATVCDSAQEYNNQISMLGTFETLEAKDFPLVKSSCSYVFQMRWDKSEEGEHAIRVVFTNENGQETLPAMESQAIVSIPDGGHITTTNYIINLHKLQFSGPGLFTASLYVDDQFCGSTQLQIIKRIEPILFSGTN